MSKRLVSFPLYLGQVLVDNSGNEYVVAPGPDPMPTKAGAYNDVNGIAWILDTSGGWYSSDDDTVDNSAFPTGPMTPLLPQEAAWDVEAYKQETAKAVLAAIRESAGPTVWAMSGGADVAKTFGVEL